MKKALIWVGVALFLLSTGNILLATDKGKPEEAKAMVEKAVTYVKASGNEKAFAEFNDPKGKFVDRDLYIWVADISAQAKCLAHGANAKLIGKELIEFKDSDGKAFIGEIVNGAKSKGNGWVDYKWTNPVTKNIERKSVYFEKLNNLVIACGFYK